MMKSQIKFLVELKNGHKAFEATLRDLNAKYAKIAGGLESMTFYKFDQNFVRGEHSSLIDEGVDVLQKRYSAAVSKMVTGTWANYEGVQDKQAVLDGLQKQIDEFYSSGHKQEDDEKNFTSLLTNSVARAQYMVDNLSAISALKEVKAENPLDAHQEVPTSLVDKINQLLDNQSKFYVYFVVNFNAYSKKIRAMFDDVLELRKKNYDTCDDKAAFNQAFYSFKNSAGIDKLDKTFNDVAGKRSVANFDIMTDPAGKTLDFYKSCVEGFFKAGQDQLDSLSSHVDDLDLLKDQLDALC